VIEAEEAAVLEKLDAAQKRRESVQAYMSARAVEEEAQLAEAAYDSIVNNSDETQLESTTFPEAPGQTAADGEYQQLTWIKCLEPLPSTAEELAAEKAIERGDSVEDITGRRAVEKKGLVYRNVVEQLSDHPTGVTVGDEVAVTGFGGCVWYSGTVTGQSTRTGARKKKNSKKKQEPMYTVFFPADCKTSEMELTADTYGTAHVKTDTTGKTKAEMGWFILGSHHLCVPDKYGGNILDGGNEV